MPDPNANGLLVCADDRDQYDPYRLAPRPTEDITFKDPRPDVPVTGQGPTPIYPQPLDGVTEALPSRVWLPNTVYAVGAQVTPIDPNDQNNVLPTQQFICVQPGQSGGLPPTWPTKSGVIVQDGGARWLCLGIYLV